jgi:CheY-like chemotaxis protein
MDVQPRILIAEDETIVRLDLRGLLESAGYDVCAEARDGVEAVELATTTAPDLAILDVKMPRLDGIEAAKRIAATRPIPIVMLTAYGYGEVVTRALDAGVFADLVKPFRESELLLAVQTAFARHAAAAGSEAVPVDVDLASAAGGPTWALTFLRRPDGRLDVAMRDAAR